MEMLLHAAQVLDRQGGAEWNDDVACVPDLSEALRAIPLAKPPRADSGLDSDESRSWNEADDDSTEYIERRVPKNRGNRTRAEPYRRTVESHNEVEKRRRAYLSSCYNTLRDTLPSIAGSKASNVTVLRTAADEIAALVAEERKRAAQVMKMRSYRVQLLSFLGRPVPPLQEELPPLFRTPVLADSDSDEAEFDQQGTDEEAAVPEAMTIPHSSGLAEALSEQLQEVAKPLNSTTKSGRRVRMSSRARELF